MARRSVIVELPSLEFGYLIDALEGLARRPCNTKNCGSVCLCDPCAARRLLPQLRAAAHYGKV